MQEVLHAGYPNFVDRR